MKKIKNLNLLLKLALSSAILVLLIAHMDGPHMLFIMGENFKASAWFWASAFILVQIVLLSVRWGMLINIGKRHISFMDAVKINLTSQLANILFIATIGGILVRIGLSVQQGVSIFKSLIATLFDRLMTFGALILLSAAYMPGLAKYVDSNTFTIFSVYISILIFMVFVFSPLFINIILFRMPATTRLRGRMRYGMRYLKVLIRNPSLCGKIITISLIAQMSFFTATYFIVQSTDANLNFWQLMTVLPIISLLSALPISVGGWGVREGAFVYFLGLLGVPMETAFMISVQIGLLGILITVATGTPYILMSNFHPLRLPATLREGLIHLQRRF